MWFKTETYSLMLTRLEGLIKERWGHALGEDPSLPLSGKLGLRASIRGHFLPIGVPLHSHMAFSSVWVYCLGLGPTLILQHDFILADSFCRGLLYK
jgi:hypothetical protein